MRIPVSSRSFVGVLLVSALLASCGGTTTSKVTCTQQYWNGTVGICLPTDWQVMDRERVDQYGVGADTVLSLQTMKPVSGTLPTIVITQEMLKQPMNTTAYSAASIRAVSTLPGYQLIDERTTNVDGVSSEIHVYSAQPATDQPKNRYYQVSAVSKGVGYTATAYAPLSISQTLEQQIFLMLDSFTFVAPKSK